MGEMKEPKISVIIPAKNSGRTIGKCILSVFQQDYSPLEVIVVDGGSVDNTRDIAKARGAKVFLEPEHKGNAPGVGRNYGAKKAKGDILAFLDSDCYPEKTWLSRTVKILSNPKVGVYAIVVRDKNGNIVSRAYHYLQMQVSYDFAPSRCMAIRKNLFWRADGFDEALTSGEDNVFSYRIEESGCDVIIDKETKIYHDDDHTASLSGIWNQQMWYLEAERKLRQRLPQRFKRFKTTSPLREHLIPVAKSVRDEGLGFAVICLLIKLLSIRRHL